MKHKEHHEWPEHHEWLERLGRNGKPGRGTDQNSPIDPNPDTTRQPPTPAWRREDDSDLLN